MSKKRNDGRIKKCERRSPATEFKPGHKTWNKGLSGWNSGGRSHETRFKPGQLPHNTAPKGHVRRHVRHRKGKVQIEYYTNIDWHGNRKANNNYKWYLWEVHHQQDRQKNMILAVKNGNQDDLRIDNFEVITRAENLRRNSPRML